MKQTYQSVIVVVLPLLVWPSKSTPLRKSKQLAGECHRSSWAVYVMLCRNLCECGTVAHDVCETVGGSVAV